MGLILQFTWIIKNIYIRYESMSKLRDIVVYDINLIYIWQI